ncbi:MAG: TIGR03085 family metal-binding protein [Angustibacter sp.]
MTNFARAERLALSDTLLSTGPDVPTLCEGWSARDLAAHLVVRERRPDAAPGMWLSALAGHTESVQAGVAATEWSALVDQVRQGPPVWHPARVAAVDEAMNTAEFFVHHEDVLRAQPGWRARELPHGEERALWRAASVAGRLALRQAPSGVELVAPGFGRAVVHRGHPMVRVEGAPSELLLWAFGRRSVAQVHLDGPNDAVERLQGSAAGL